jgi:hypothetical protein
MYAAQNFFNLYVMLNLRTHFDRKTTQKLSDTWQKKILDLVLPINPYFTLVFYPVDVFVDESLPETGRWNRLQMVAFLGCLVETLSIGGFLL